MVFSFDMVYPRRTATLPSVESWGTNMNIVKDPPKSIFTRRINKVGSDNKLMNTIRGGSNRFSENIQIYARGVNPSVSVSYNNTGMTNGTDAVPQRQAHPAYKTMDNGAFRPDPVEGGLTQLLPLSRMNRNTTFSLANKSNKNVAILNSQCDPPKKTIHKNLLKAQQKTARSNNIHKAIENYKVKHVISNPVSTFASANLRGQNNIINNNRINIDSFIDKNHQTTFTSSNISGNKVRMNHNLPIETYTKDALQGQFNTIKKSEYTKNINQQDHDLDRKLPVYSQESSRGSQSQVYNNINRDVKLNEILHANTHLNKAKIQGTKFLSRNAKLLPKIKAESRHLSGNSRPQEYWENHLPTLNNLKLNARYSS